ncbi:mRNA interferase MazF [Oribacterium sp. KHPX15]|uniref:type II toxin-antitoxin system PemK/MazF family toxin n=1 Tax=Oribacterium sp. KHPX15 TaxID=1855342 RepID=UPI000898525E|nr:type II toxin-antitoxin system PemK/MazF family toxin [Oribacterium sp. KHPX15]SDZ96346.1 mRNA interferase MazF [Oribacterium sp. KHPX15]
MTFNKGDIVKVDLNPIKGHEQGNYRPVIVMNSVPLPGDLNIILPITTKQKSYPLEVELDKRTKTQGVVLCFQIRTVDLVKRGAIFIEKAPADIVDTCNDYLHRLTDDVV